MPVVEPEPEPAPIVPRATSRSSAVAAPQQVNTKDDSSSDEPWVEETLAELHKESREPIRTPPVHHDDHSEHSHDGYHGSAGDASKVTMQIEGKTEVVLGHRASGQEVSVQFEADCICVTLAGGTEIRIPMAEARRLRAVG